MDEQCQPRYMFLSIWQRQQHRLQLLPRQPAVRSAELLLEPLRLVPPDRLIAARQDHQVPDPVEECLRWRAGAEEALVDQVGHAANLGPAGELSLKVALRFVQMLRF